MNYEFRYVRGHVEVFLHGSFLFSADTQEEARHEIYMQEEKNIPWSAYYSNLSW